MSQEVEWTDEAPAAAEVEWEDSPLSREELFDKHYWNGGDKVGGYARDQFGGAYRDFACHEVTACHVLARRPESVLEIGAARGYVLKRIQDAGIPAMGLEISKHCWLTRVCDGILRHDLCNTPWPVETKSGDRLCFSIAVMEHIPEQFLPAVIAEMQRTCYRGLHGIDFGAKDDGFDRTHSTLKPKAWWVEQFAKNAPGWPVEIVDKEELEQGQFPEEVQKGDGKVKLNIGSFTTMHYHGWENIDVHDLAGFAQQNGYKFRRCDVRKGIPLATSTVDLIVANHMLEHLTYAEGLEFLRECRRLLKAEGAMRIVVPDAALLIVRYQDEVSGTNFLAPDHQLSEFDEINDGAAQSPTPLGKLWSLLHAGHSAAYDWSTMEHALHEAGFKAFNSGFRKCIDHPGSRQIRAETVDMIPCVSLAVDAIPDI